LLRFQQIGLNTKFILHEDVEDNLFSTKPPEVPEEPVKPKKPVGGVSMFGGFDPTSALKKRQEKNVPKNILDGLKDGQR
jgi:hypothetical protein